jgi:large subunit ribosomal protein L22
MTGPKLNEATRVAGVSSVVLNLVRGMDVKSADNLLRITDRDSAHIVRKLLASAVANATNNFSQNPDELYIKACYADGGPTLKRFRPRAKGSSAAIFKRTSHVTIVVDKLSDAALAVRETQSESRGGAQAAQRKSRVEASRARAQKAKEASAADKAESQVETKDEKVTEK